MNKEWGINMKKYLSVFILSVLVLNMISCGQSKIDNTNSKSDTNTTIISGEFTVEVRDVIPDYCMDDITPCVAIVTEFQSYPFTIYVGEEIGSQLQKNNQYVFSIEPVEVNYSMEELQEMNLSSLVWEINEIKITKFRLTQEDEWGLDSLQLTFTESTKQ